MYVIFKAYISALLKNYISEDICFINNNNNNKNTQEKIKHSSK